MRKSNYDYSKTMMMKLDIGIPDNKDGCKLNNTFEQALEKIKTVDALTLGAPKIIYLVGWQYQGHDDKYPAFFEVNEAAKRPQDKTALESLLWLVDEAKKYNTTVSYHINLSDAYPNSPLWNEYLENDLILKNCFSKIKKTGMWNDRTAYQVRFAEEYKSGYFRKRVDKLLELLPIENAGTVHIDAFFVRKGKRTSIREEKLYRRKMIEYFNSRGIDVTSEFIYRERNNGLRLHYGESDTIGYIPAVWNLVMTQKDYLRYPPNILAGGKLNTDLQKDKDLQYLFYGNTSGENSFNLDKNWQESFTREFALGSVPYFYLNAHKILKINGRGKNRTAVFTDGIKTAVRDKSITCNGKSLKENNTLCIPVDWKRGSYYAWSEIACEKSFSFGGKRAGLYKITENGAVFIKKINAVNGMITLTFDGKTAYELKEI